MIHRYHDGTKHAFHRFARSLGYLDWASQPNPFRSFAGAPVTALAPRDDAPALPVPAGIILRHALGLTAWKQFGASRWSLRANPSSGNLHPTEAYLVCALDDFADHAAVYHYAPERHVIEQRCRFTAVLPASTFLVLLTSIHWRESWKYGERAFRYCQHDLGHAIAAVRIAATLVGWEARLAPEWSHAAMASLAGIDRDEDYVDAEREEAGALIVVARRPDADGSDSHLGNPESLVAAVRRGRWTGRASQLSEDHVQWTFVDEIADATRDPGRRPALCPPASAAATAAPAYPAGLLLQRRSAVAFDGHSSIGMTALMDMLRATLPDRPPFDALWWSARVHLALFVHRVDGLEPGLYLLIREPASGERLKAALGREFSFETVATDVPVVRLARGDCRAIARRLSCDQDIAADGFYSVGMIAEFDRSLDEFGPAFYRRLFWESGVVGQVLYLEAEAAGARATGIGCFYDDAVHEVLGLSGHAFQSLYHFTVGTAVDDTRLTTQPGYDWEAVKPRE